MKKFYDWVYEHSFKFWDNYNCPLYYYDQGPEDGDDRCQVYTYCESPCGIICFLPKFMKKMANRIYGFYLNWYYRDIEENL